MAKAEPRFKRGDSVQLKSGGPKMTVSRYNVPTALEMAADFTQPPEPTYTCHWFSGSKLNQGAFAEDELQPSGEPKSAKTGRNRR